jgi:competence protein ComEA
MFRSALPVDGRGAGNIIIINALQVPVSAEAGSEQRLGRDGAAVAAGTLSTDSASRRYLRCVIRSGGGGSGTRGCEPSDTGRTAHVETTSKGEIAMKKLLALFAALVAYVGLAFGAVNVNTASKEQLESLDGIGPVKAQAIIDYRKKNGPFKSLEDVKKVDGVGDATFDKIRKDIALSGETKVAAPAKADAKKEEPKKAEAKKEEPKKVDDKKAAADKKAADKKAGEEKKAATDKKADDKKAADKKAGEEKKAATDKKADDKKAADKKAGEEKKAATDKKADDKKAADKKAGEEKKAAADKKSDDKKAADKKAADEKKAAEKK